MAFNIFSLSVKSSIVKRNLSTCPLYDIIFYPFSAWTMKGFLTSSEGHIAPHREGKANLMNDLIDGYRDGGWD